MKSTWLLPEQVVTTVGFIGDPERGLKHFLTPLQSAGPSIDES